MTEASRLRRELSECPAGEAGWRRFEDLCIEALRFLFVPPLNEPIIQPRSKSGIDRRDAVLPNRNIDAANNWGHLYKELGARMILFEFKNYDRTEVGKDETNQVRNYMKPPMGRLGVLCSNRKPNDAAHTKRNTIYSEDGRVILFITVDHMREMILIRERGDDPSDLILDLVEEFYLQHE